MSNSLVVDLDNDPGDMDSLKKDLASAVTQTKDETPPAGDESDLDNAVPDKYAGKTTAQVIEMHQNAEAELGRRGNELGQYKTLTDQLLDVKRSDDLRKGGAPEEDIPGIKIAEVDSTELIADPTKVLTDVVTDALNQDRENRNKDEQNSLAAKTQQAFNDKHPTAGDIANDPEFIKWVQASPSRALAGYQASQGDLTSGDALLTEWSQVQDASKDVEDEDPPKKETNPNLAAARRASTESTGANQTADAPTGKTYRRVDLIRLKLQDPEAYADEGFQKEILTAYAEGRVK